MSQQIKQVEIKQVRSTSFNNNYKPYDRRQSQPLNQTFEQKLHDCHQSNQSTGQDLIENDKQSQMLQVLEQQININQYLEQQVNTLQQQLIKQQKIIQQQSEISHVLEQLNVYKELVEQFEYRLKDILKENEELNQYNQKQQQKIYYLEDEIRKYQQILDEKIHEQVKGVMSPDVQRKMKRLIEENAILKQSNKQMEDEVNELRKSLEQFKESIQTLRLHNSTQDNNYVAELENQVQYLQEMQQIDQLKMQALEEKLSLLQKENYRLQDNLKSKRKQLQS
ncbi:unnamed protein product [Paramecium sonneborni]|uniref:Uncharacterized protein n=1 Tax=Paramecium sonneborni TaxID=65129 RepID=A0A8S1K4X2_9CILI|nr:unnamed protein product [Paramecium sonneborni]